MSEVSDPEPLPVWPVLVLVEDEKGRLVVLLVLLVLLPMPNIPPSKPLPLPRQRLPGRTNTSCHFAHLCTRRLPPRQRHRHAATQPQTDTLTDADRCRRTWLALSSLIWRSSFIRSMRYANHPRPLDAAPATEPQQERRGRRLLLLYSMSSPAVFQVDRRALQSCPVDTSEPDALARRDV